jgi:hypothetical protein
MTKTSDFYIDETSIAPVVRWKSNDRVPPKDCLDEMLSFGWITKQEFDNSNEERDIETKKAIDEYRKVMAEYVPSPEEIFEMRANFGEGATVVNVITGKSIQL